MVIMACLLGLAAFPATAINLAQSPRTAISRGSVAVYQEWLEKSVIVVLMVFIRSRMVAAHVSSDPWSFQGLSGISFSNVFCVKLWQRSVILMTMEKSVERSPNILIKLGNKTFLWLLVVSFLAKGADYEITAHKGCMREVLHPQ